MSKPLPTHGFRWLDEVEKKNLTVQNIEEDSSDGYILEVDLEYPSILHDKHSDYPLAPEAKQVQPDDLSQFSHRLANALGLNPKSSLEKLIPNLHNKSKYVLHYRNLQQYIKHGLILKKIHRILTFKQSSWLKPYIELNTEMRKKAKNAFEKDMFKLMNNR